MALAPGYIFWCLLIAGSQCTNTTSEVRRGWILEFLSSLLLSSVIDLSPTFCSTWSLSFFWKKINKCASETRKREASWESQSAPSVLQITWKPSAIAKRSYYFCYWTIQSYVGTVHLDYCFQFFPRHHVASGRFSGEWAAWHPHPEAFGLSQRDLLWQWDISVCDMRRDFKYAHVGCLGCFSFGVELRRAGSEHPTSLGWRHMELTLTWSLMQRCTSWPAELWVGKIQISFS